MGNGILRILKALRHEAPFVAQTKERLGCVDSQSCAHIFKTIHTPHGGKISLARIFAGTFSDGLTVYGRDNDERISGVFTMLGQEPSKRDVAGPGDTVALGRLESIQTGESLSENKGDEFQIDVMEPAKPVFGMSIEAKERKDEVKLTTALGKVIDEDRSISLVHNQDLGEMSLWGQGEMHLRVALERLTDRYGVDAKAKPRQIPYRETIRKSIEVRGRHKKQSGGHGQFGDVVVDIKPLPRGQGFEFTETISGGVVPRQYIPSVEVGVRGISHSRPAWVYSCRCCRLP